MRFRSLDNIRDFRVRPSNDTVKAFDKDSGSLSSQEKAVKRSRETQYARKDIRSQPNRLLDVKQAININSTKPAYPHENKHFFLLLQ